MNDVGSSLPYYPLKGIRVLEFCWIWAGPFLGQFLADLGAEVIKVEWRDRFDPYRTRGVERLRGKIPEARRQEMSPSFHSLNRNKVGFSVNVKAPEGVDLVKKLAAKSDMLIENWTSGTLDRLGLGAKDLAAVNRKLVYVSLSAFGPASRLRDMRSYGLVTSSLGGIESLIGMDGEMVGSPTFVTSDPNASLFGLLASMAGLIQVGGGGDGTNVVVSQLEAVMTVAQSGHPPKPAERMDTRVLRASDGRYVTVSLPAGAPTDLEPEIARRTAEEAVAFVEGIGGHAATVINVLDTPYAPIFDDLEVRLSESHPVTGDEEIIAAPWRVNGRRAPLRKTAPQLGEGNTYILNELLGLTDAEVAALREKGVV